MVRIKSRFGEFRRAVVRGGDGNGAPPQKLVPIRGSQGTAGPATLTPLERKQHTVQKIGVELESKGHAHSLEILNEDEAFKAALEKASPLQAGDLLKCIEELDAPEHTQLFMDLFAEYADAGILWFPFVMREVVPYTDECSTEMLLAGSDKIDAYISRFKECAVSFLEAEEVLGLSAIGRVFSGRPLHVEVVHTDGYCTFPGGAIHMPAVCWTFDEKQANMDDYEQGVCHEQSHHKYHSFRVNLHPGTFDYATAGIGYVSSEKTDSGARVVVSKGGEEHEVAGLEDLVKLSRNPKLLRYIWNVLDDRRVDKQFIDEFPGKERVYSAHGKRVLKEVRKDITDDASGALEALLQVALIGETRNPIPQGVNKMLEPVWKLLNAQDLDTADAGDSLAYAMAITDILAPHLPKFEEGYAGAGGKSGSDVSEGTLVVEAPGEGRGANAPGETSSPSGSGGGIPYDSHTSAGKVRGAWKVAEVSPKAWRPVAVPRSIEERVQRAFRKHFPKDGALVRGLESGDPDVELQIEHRRMRRAGIILPPDYYSDVLHIKRSVVMGLLLDLSGSMSGEKLERTLIAARALEGGAVLLGDDVITMGFTGEGNAAGSGNRVLMCPVGWPGSRIRMPVGISGSTPLGGAVRHMDARMRDWKRKKSKKLAHMLVVTDGQPNVCPGVSADRGENEAVYDSMMAVDDARKMGVRVFGIIILEDDEEEEKYRKDYDRIFGRGHYMVFRSLEHLPSFFERYYSGRVLKQGER